jgi:RNA polymerase sigma-70 factor (ECF subfamily)
VSGAADVARQIALTGPRFAALARPVLVNGAAGVVVDAPGQARVVVAFGVVGGRIVSIDLIGDPTKVRS